MSEWASVESAPYQGVVLLTVEGSDGGRRTFVAERSHDGRSEQWVWLITTGWAGWNRLHPAWTPIAWKTLPEPFDGPPA